MQPPRADAEAPDGPGPSAPRRRRPLLGVAAVVVLLLLAAVGVRHVAVQAFWVPSGSMRPVLQEGDVLLVDRTERSTARRGEIVVLDGSGYFGPGEDGHRYWVKRVIGVGGDRVRCCDDAGRLEVDGAALAEPYLAPGTAPSEVRFDVEVPAGTVFVLGDARADSSDSRNHLGSPGGGMIPESRIVGEVSRIVWPLPRAGVVPRIGSPR